MTTPMQKAIDADSAVASDPGTDSRISVVPETQAALLSRCESAVALLDQRGTDRPTPLDRADAAKCPNDLVALAEAIASGAITALAATEAAIARAATRSDLNAVVAIDADAARLQAMACDQARAAGRLLGPLHGVPLAHKDMFHRAGRVSGHGSQRRADVSDHTATVLRRLDAAGAIDLGRLHMAEFAMGPTGHNAHLGRCGNPWHRDVISGGSSSGSGAAVAARIVMASLGSDTGGSIRLPASFCGVVGLKPTQGRLPMDGVMQLSASFDTVGPIARSSRDIARLMGVLTDGEDFESRLDDGVGNITIGVSAPYYGEGLADEVEDALREAICAFTQLGARVVPVTLQEHHDFASLAGLIWLPEAAAQHFAELRDRPETYGEQVRNRLHDGLAIPATSYLRASALRARHRAAILTGAFARCDLILTPACRTIAPLAEQSDVSGGAAMDRTIGDISALTRTISYLGLPAITTPMGRDHRGVPIGLQLIGRPDAEAVLIRAAHAFEGATGWLDNSLP